MMPLMQFVGNLGYVLVAILGGFLVIRNTIEVGQIQSFIQYVRSFNQPITQLAHGRKHDADHSGFCRTSFEFLEEDGRNRSITGHSAGRDIKRKCQL